MGKEHERIDLPLSPQQEAEAVMLRPSWCPLKDVCLPVHRVSDDGDANNAEFCFGVDRGGQTGEDAVCPDTIHARGCWMTDNYIEPGSLGLNIDSTVNFIAGMSLAHATQWEFIVKETAAADEQLSGEEE